MDWYKQFRLDFLDKAPEELHITEDAVHKWYNKTIVGGEEGKAMQLSRDALALEQEKREKEED